MVSRKFTFLFNSLKKKGKMVLNFESKNALIWCIYNLKQLVSTVNPLLSHPRGFLIPNTFGGGGGGLMATGDLFNLAKTMVKAQVQEAGGLAAKDERQI